MPDLVLTLITEEEGVSAHAYKDTLGLLTIGIGCLVDASVRCDGLCNEAINAQFEHDSADARRWAAALPGFAACNDVRRAVLVSMCFQLGDLHDWPHFKAALGAGDFNAAADAGLASLWASQTPERAQRAMNMLRTGAWQLQNPGPPH